MLITTLLVLIVLILLLGADNVIHTVKFLFGLSVGLVVVLSLLIVCSEWL